MALIICFIFMFFVHIYIFHAQLYGSNFVCDTFGKYQNEIIHCDAGSDCNIQCGFTANECCEKATIYCPDNYECNIMCGGLRACSFITIYGNSASILNVTANGGGNDNLGNSKIYCPIDGDCYIHCDSAYRGCKLSNITAIHSNLIHFKCVNDDADECDQVTVYCPNTKAPNNCIFEGLSDTIRMTDMNIYSLHGFDTVSIQNNINSIGTMYCNTNYASQCIISSNSNSCQLPNILCNAAITTNNPTSVPTTYPTTTYPTSLSPTTLNPTTSSPITISPTTSNPTTLSPIISPTTSSPTTISPTTSNPTTSNPTTSNPTTLSPIISPTTSNPTTSNPTTLSPIISPTTSSPTTTYPTTVT
eukprot:41908_1